MLRILGPTYRYQGETIQDDIVYIDDHCYDEHSGSFPVKQLLDNNPGDYLLVFDHLGHEDQMHSYRHVCLPVYLADETQRFRQHDIQPDWTNKTHCFNFMINKPRLGRIKLLELIQDLNLSNFRHTLCWQSSPYSNIPVTNFKFGPEEELGRGIRNGHYTNPMVYEKLLQKQVFEPTCVSLISEPCYIEKEIMITEKTLMSIYAGTLPIWTGGWRLPDAMRDLGFDVFDDIIDHSYSSLPDPYQRLCEALSRNMDLLQKLDYVREIVEGVQSRLKYNLDLIRKRNVFGDLVRERIEHNPRLIQVADQWPLALVN